MILCKGKEHDGIKYEVKYVNNLWFASVTSYNGDIHKETNWRCPIVPRCGASSLDIDRANNWLEFEIDKMREGGK